jgi:putative transcriptional regulator
MKMFQHPKMSIKWRLRELMARHRVSNRDLAEVLQKHETTIARLKGDDMPTLNGQTLNLICKTLNCTPMDLIEYMPDDDAA